MFVLKVNLNLKDMTSNSKSRIILSSLYIGTGSMEHELVNISNLNSKFI